MVSPLYTTLTAVLIVIFAGFVMRLTKLVTPDHTSGLERISYYIFYPALFIDTIAKSELNATVLVIGAALLIGVVCTAGIVFLLKPVFTKTLHHSNSAFTSIFQGATRWQTFIALVVAKGVFGVSGAASVAIAIAAMTPVLNIMCVWVLIRYGRNSGQKNISYTKQLFSNPIIISCIIGIVLNLTHVQVPEPFANSLSIAGQAGLASALILVGTGLDLKTLLKIDFGIILTTMLKLGVLPAISISAAILLGVSGTSLAVVALCSSVPSAGASYILARQMGGDAAYMARILTFQTIASMLTLPFILALVMRY